MSKYAKELPQDPEARKAVLKEVDKIVDALLEINSLNDVIKDAKSYVQDRYEVDGGYIKGLADIKYDLEYNEQKKAGKIREQGEMLDLVEEFSNSI